jgi:hypothetical protein
VPGLRHDDQVTGRHASTHEEPQRQPREQPATPRLSGPAAALVVGLRRPQALPVPSVWEGIHHQV